MGKPGLGYEGGKGFLFKADAFGHGASAAVSVQSVLLKTFGFCSETGLLVSLPCGHPQ